MLLMEVIISLESQESLLEHFSLWWLLISCDWQVSSIIGSIFSAAFFVWVKGSISSSERVWLWQDSSYGPWSSLEWLWQLFSTGISWLWPKQISSSIYLSSWLCEWPWQLCSSSTSSWLWQISWQSLSYSSKEWLWLWQLSIYSTRSLQLLTFPPQVLSI